MATGNLALIDAFCDNLWLEQGLAKNSLEAYRRDMRLFADWLEATRPALANLLAVQGHDIAAYFAQRHAESKPSSVNRRLSVLKRFYQLALRQHQISDDPCLKMPSAKQAVRLVHTLTEHQVEALLAAPDVSTPLGLRERTMLELMYASGLRVSELVMLKTVELSLNDGVLRVTGKGSKTRLVPFGQQARLWIERYLKDARGVILSGQADDALFVTARGGAMTRQMFWVLIKKHAARAQITGQTTGMLKILFHRTPCVMLLPPTCSITVPTCAWCSCYWAIRTSRPLRFTRMWRANGSNCCTQRITRAAKQHGTARNGS